MARRRKEGLELTCRSSTLASGPSAMYPESKRPPSLPGCMSSSIARGRRVAARGFGKPSSPKEGITWRGGKAEGGGNCLRLSASLQL